MTEERSSYFEKLMMEHMGFVHNGGTDKEKMESYAAMLQYVRHLEHVIKRVRDVVGDE